jgi:hypothetical protein
VSLATARTPFMLINNMQKQVREDPKSVSVLREAELNVNELLRIIEWNIPWICVK